MSRTPISDPAARRGQEGFTLAALIVALTIISVIVAYTVPDQWSMVMARERDRQTIFVMRQFARAILTFQEKHKVLPSSLEQIQEARRPRVVRNGGAWPCPLTGEPDWILVPPQAVTGANMPGAAGPNAGTPEYVPGGGNRGGLGNATWGNTPGNRNLGNNPPGAAVPQPTPGQITTGSRLNPQLSPADYKGQFVGVRPRKTGQSFIALNGIENYEEWVFTWQDMRAEVMARNQALYKQ